MLKNVFCVAVFAILFVFAGFQVFADERVKSSEMKEYISDEWPLEIKQFFGTTPIANVGQIFFSTKGTEIPDYAIVDFVTSREKAFLYEMGELEIRVMCSVRQKKDEKGEVVKDEQGAILYECQMVTVVLYDLRLSWYKSAEVKDIFLKATE